MPVFRVTFFKNICSDTGEDVDAVQGSFEIDAASAGEAEDAAKERFRHERSIPSWALHADRLEVELTRGRASPRTPAAIV